MYLRDRLTLDAPRRDSSGNFIASVLAARIGTQDYAGYELGKPELARVTVYRPAEEVFSRDSMASFAGAPVTIEHPGDLVTPENWKDHAVGEVASDDIVKDGEAIRVPFMLRDAEAIRTVEGGKREISMGYTSAIEWGDGVAPDGTPYQATQRQIRINHLAIVDRARGGPTLRIGDKEPEMTTKTITFDGLPLLVTDAAEAAIGKLLGQITVLTTAKDTAEAKTVADAATIVAKDAEIVKLTADLAAAKITPAQMRDAAKAYSLTCDKAKAMGITVTDAMDEAAIKRAVVDKQMGDAAKGYSDDHVSIAFDALTKDAKVETVRTIAPNGTPVNLGDAASQEAKALADANDHNGWRNKAA